MGPADPRARRCLPQLCRSPMRGSTGTEPPGGRNTPKAWNTEQRPRDAGSCAEDQPPEVIGGFGPDTLESRRPRISVVGRLGSVYLGWSVPRAGLPGPTGKMQGGA